MTRHLNTCELELACCQLGYSAEMLVFLASVQWLSSSRDKLLPNSLVNRFAIVDTSLRAITDGAPNIRVQKAAERLLAIATSAKVDLEVRWQSEERYALLDSLEAADEECIPMEWLEENSLLSQSCWKSFLKARTSLANALPQKLRLCFVTGDLVVRVERLVVNAEDGATPGERYPIQALGYTLVKLRENHTLLKDVDVSLRTSSGITGINLDECQRQAQEIYEDVCRRFSISQPLRKMTAAEANVATREYLLGHPKATQREIAVAIGCSHGSVGKTPAWKAVQERRRANRQPKSKRATSLSDRVLDEVGTQDDQLQKLIADQESDDEKSPLKEGNSKTFAHKRV